MRRKHRRKTARRPAYRPSPLTRKVERLATASAAAVKRGDLATFARIEGQVQRATYAEGRPFHYTHWQAAHRRLLRNPHPRGRFRKRRPTKFWLTLPRSHYSRARSRTRRSGIFVPVSRLLKSRRKKRRDSR